MNRADKWLGIAAPNAAAGNQELRANDTARVINAQPVSIVILRSVPGQRGLQELAPQTVRVDVMQASRNANEMRDIAAAITEEYVVIMGYKDNPQVPNTDILRGDRFFFRQRMWEVLEFIDTVPGRFMASAKLMP